MPCTGTLSNVPKRMGWLWTAEDVPGLKVSNLNYIKISAIILLTIQKSKQDLYFIFVLFFIVSS